MSTGLDKRVLVETARAGYTVAGSDQFCLLPLLGPASSSPEVLASILNSQHTFQEKPDQLRHPANYPPSPFSPAILPYSAHTEAEFASSLQTAEALVGGRGEGKQVEEMVQMIVESRLVSWLLGEVAGGGREEDVMYRVMAVLSEVISLLLVSLDRGQHLMHFLLVYIL